MAPAGERPLFADTNLGTHLAVAVPEDITVGNLKKKLGREHSACFPKFGKIKVRALLVKRKIHHYHLPDSMPVWNVFNGLRITWFLFMDISPLEGAVGLAAAMPHTLQGHEEQTQRRSQLKKNLSVERTLGSALETSSRDASGRTLEDIGARNVLLETVAGLDYQQEKRRKDGGGAMRLELLDCGPDGGSLLSEDARWRKHERPSWLAETPSESLPGGISITGIISSYFSDLDDVDSWTIRAAAAFERVLEADKNGEDRTKNSGPASVGAAPFDADHSSKQSENRVGDMGKTSETIPHEDSCENHRDDCWKCIKDNATGNTEPSGHRPRPTESACDSHMESSSKLRRNEVGKRLVLATSKSRPSSGKKMSRVSMITSRRGKSLVGGPPPPISDAVFDFIYSDD